MSIQQGVCNNLNPYINKYKRGKSINSIVSHAKITKSNMSA